MNSRALIRLMLAAAFFALAAGVALVLAVGLPQRSDATAFIAESGERVAPDLNALAPPFVADTYGGGTLALNTLRGQTVILNFWATWCAPCAVEMPELQRLHEDFSARGVTVLGVNLAEPPESIAVWQQHYGLTFPLLLDPALEIATLYQLRGQPYTLVIAPNGVIVGVFFGPTTYDALSRFVNNDS